MALINDPKAWIVLMFQKEEREGRGEHCETFPNGCAPDFLNCADGELVYGIYKSKYYFSPAALHVRESGRIKRIPWAEIQSCTTQHGDGKKTSVLTLRNGTTHDIRVSDLATGWSGRISQLFHQMVERWGCRTVLGLQLVTFDQFFATAADEYSLFPNLTPHPTLNALRESLERLASRNGVFGVRIIVADDDAATGIGIAIHTTLESSELEPWASSLGADGVIDASQNLQNAFGVVGDGSHILEIFWD
jgi:hypothetical protein